MNKKEKFENFLESLKGNGQDKLIESIKKGYNTCMESGSPYLAEMSQEVTKNIAFLKKLHTVVNSNDAYMRFADKVAAPNVVKIVQLVDKLRDLLGDTVASLTKK